MDITITERWPNLGRERIDQTKRKTLNRSHNKYLTYTPKYRLKADKPITKQQLDLLKALNPYKGYRTSHKQAAEIMGVNIKRVRSILASLKRLSPNIYEDFKNLRGCLHRCKGRIERPYSLTDLDYKEWGREVIQDIF